jgi:hypothetical protein
VKVVRTPPSHAGAPANLDEKFRTVAAQCAERAGLRLSEKHFAVLLEQTPSALALAARLPRDHTGGDELASAFTLS